MFTCFILFKTEYKEHLYTIILTIATIISMVLIARSHIASIDNKEKTLSSYTKTIIKYTWIVISLFSYNISRALISITLDISFDSTNDRPITFLFSFFVFFGFTTAFITYFSSSYFTSQNLLTFHATKKIKKNLSRNRISPFSYFTFILYIYCII